ncbi:MAG: polysaccharide biosynthesis/export family protein [Phycisphaerae bacterium]
MGVIDVKKTALIFVCAVGIVLAVLSGGCGDNFFDPTQIGRFRPVPAVNVILDSLGVADEQPAEWAGAEDPKPIDIMTFEDDYTFAPGDRVRISIFELLQQGDTYVNDFVVTETGRISIPEVGIVDAAGLTESQLEQEISQILSPSVLKEPLVTVIALSSERRVFSILGNGVQAPGRYGIPRYDFRLNDALATAQVAPQFNISYVYVTRNLTGREVSYETQTRPAQEPKQQQQKSEIPEQEMLEIIAPRAQVQRPNSRLVITTAEMSADYDELIDTAVPEGFETQPDFDQNAINQQEEFTANQEQQIPQGKVEWVFQDGKWVPMQVEEPQQQQTYVDESPRQIPSGRVEWVFRDGKWVPMQVGEPQRQERYTPEPGRQIPPTQPRQQIPEQFDWDQLGTAGVQTRLIKIPTDKLLGGDPRYNIIVRPGDTIHVPLDVIGEFAIMGNVNSQGYINLTGRPMTLKMAVAAAGGLGPLAWPKRCEVTRRVGKNKEETVMVDLDKIARGEEPDFFIKPNDLINVGTHPTSRWRAVLRNAFRATYGFGFIYDRNFADRDYGTSRPLPNWF